MMGNLTLDYRRLAAWGAVLALVLVLLSTCATPGTRGTSSTTPRAATSIPAAPTTLAKKAGG